MQSEPQVSDMYQENVLKRAADTQLIGNRLWCLHASVPTPITKSQQIMVLSSARSCKWHKAECFALLHDIRKSPIIQTYSLTYRGTVVSSVKGWFWETWVWVSGSGDHLFLFGFSLERKTAVTFQPEMSASEALRSRCATTSVRPKSTRPAV